LSRCVKYQCCLASPILSFPANLHSAPQSIAGRFRCQAPALHQDSQALALQQNNSFVLSPTVPVTPFAYIKPEAKMAVMALSVLSALILAEHRPSPCWSSWYVPSSSQCPFSKMIPSCHMNLRSHKLQVRCISAGSCILLRGSCHDR